MSATVTIPANTLAALAAAHGIAPSQINQTSNLPLAVQAALKAPPVVNTSYAALINAQRNINAGNILTIKQRWDETFNAATLSQQTMFKHLLAAAKAEFRRRNPKLKKFTEINLVQAQSLYLTDIYIDTTMQRDLTIEWVLTMLNSFVQTMVVPIQVYKDSVTGQYHAWDGQHTVILLWLIATDLFGQDPATIQIPVNIYSSTTKAEIRNNFIQHNGGKGKLPLDLIDTFLQKVYGVRIDGSKDPDWIEAEKKQQQLEKHNLFVTAAKFNNTDMPGAITRLPEINKLSPVAVGWLCQYLSKVGCDARPADEKEMVMMGMFFDRCYKAKIKVTDTYIDDLANVALMLWGADFDKNGAFWAKADTAYKNWHASLNVDNDARFNKQPVHGMPFLMAQLRKSFPRPIPNIITGSEFAPDAGDLF